MIALYVVKLYTQSIIWYISITCSYSAFACVYDFLALIYSFTLLWNILLYGYIATYAI